MRDEMAGRGVLAGRGDAQHAFRLQEFLVGACDAGQQEQGAATQHNWAINGESDSSIGGPRSFV